MKAHRNRPRLEVLNYDQLELVRSADDVIVIDARIATAYDQGHIPHAINIPVLLSREQRKQIATGLNPRSRLIFYCQSETCAWAEMVAGDFSAWGYDHLFIYRGGWKDWSSHEQP